MKNVLFFLTMFAAIQCFSQLTPIPHQPVVGQLIHNEGQILDTDDSIAYDVKYYTANQGSFSWFLDDRIAHTWFRNDSSTTNEDTLYRMDARFVSCNTTSPWVNQLDSFPGVRNYFLSYLPANITNVHSYKQLTYHHLYDSITADISSNGLGLNYHFKLSPGANSNDINITFDSASTVTIDTIDGTITATTPYGGIKYFKPYAFTQDLVTADTLQFEVHFYYDGTSLSMQLYADTNAFLDSIIPLGLLPIHIQFSSISLPGLPISPNPPVTTGGPCDYFIHWSTYFGGLNDRVGDNYVDAGNFLYTGGSSDALYFPVTPGALYSTNAGMTDAVVAKFHPTRELWYATFYGGKFRDVAYGVTANSFGELCFTGYTQGDFPNLNLGGYYQSTFGGFEDAYLVILDISGSSQLMTTYFGGSSPDIAYSIACDVFDQIYIGGVTASTSSFPIQNWPGAYNQATNAGMNDAFIAKFNDNKSLGWSTFLGGPESDGINGITTLVGTVPGIDLYVKGSSFSDGSIAVSPCIENDNASTIGTTGEFPLADPGGTATVELNSTTGGTYCDVFVCVFRSNGELEWSTMYGGDGNDATVSNSDVGGISVATNGAVFITGSTKSTTGFDFAPPFGPPAGSPMYWDNSHSASDFDAYVAKFGPNAPSTSVSYTLKYSTYYGLTGDTYGTDVVAGDLYTYFTGYTYGTIETNPNLPGIFFNSTSAGSADGYFFAVDEFQSYIGGTYFGGSGDDHSLAITAIQLGASIDIILTGLTTSTDFNPLADIFGPDDYYQGAIAGDQNGFVTEVRTICALRTVSPVANANGVNELVSVFPNPSCGSFSVSLENDLIAQIEIYNALGELIMVKNFISPANNKVITLDGLSDGIYYIVATGLQNTYSCKAAVQN